MREASLPETPLADHGRSRRAVTAAALLAQSVALWRNHGSGLLVAAMVAQCARAWMWRLMPVGSSSETFVWMWCSTVVDQTLQLLTGAAMAWVAQAGPRSRSGAAPMPRGIPVLLLSALGTSLLCSVQVCALMLALVVPGLMRLTQVFVAPPLLVIEGGSRKDAMRRSGELSRGSRWAILFVFIGVRLLHTSGRWLLGPTWSPATYLPTTPSEIPSWLLDVGVMALHGTTMVVCCQLLRAHHAPPDPQRLAAVFD